MLHIKQRPPCCGNHIQRPIHRHAINFRRKMGKLLIWKLDTSIVKPRRQPKFHLYHRGSDLRCTFNGVNRKERIVLRPGIQIQFRDSCFQNCVADLPDPDSNHLVSIFSHMDIWNALHNTSH